MYFACRLVGTAFAKIKEQDEKQKEKISMILKMVTRTSEFSHEKLQTCDGKIPYI